MMSGQNGAGQVIETAVAGLAAIALAVPLRVIMPITGDHRALTMRAPNAIRPTVLPDQFKALCVVQQGRQVHQHRRGHRSPRGSLPTKPLQPPSVPLIT